MNQHEKALQWAKDYLISHEHTSIVDHHIVVETSWSVVYRIETTKCSVYLKQVPEGLFWEPDTLNFLHLQGCKNIPEILAVNPALHCFMTNSCGSMSLRHLFKGQVNLSLLKSGIITYTTIQRSLENKIQQLFSLGIPDWRNDKFAPLYCRLIQQDKLLLDDGLTEQEIERLHHLIPTCNHLCEVLSKHNIPETLSHSDFQENNMLIDEKTGDINIIDWGETVISHPFFSLNGCLWNITYWNQIKQTDLTYRQLQTQCIQPWLNLHNEKTLLELLHIANQLLGIYAALEYERLYVATQNNHKITVQQDKRGSIAGCLRTFLSWF